MDYKKKAEAYQYAEKHQYIMDCNYFVIIGGTIMGFSKIQNLIMRQERKVLSVGGETGQTETVDVEKQGMDTLILDKGIAYDMDESIVNKMVLGCEIEQLTIIVLKGAKKEVGKVFYFEKGVVTKRSFSNLTANSGNVWEVTLEISHSGLIEE